MVWKILYLYFIRNTQINKKNCHCCTIIFIVFKVKLLLIYFFIWGKTWSKQCNLEISKQRERDFILHSTQAKLTCQGFFCRWAYLLMDLCKRGGLIRWILRYCNAATTSCILWKHGSTHFPDFTLRSINQKLGFRYDLSKTTQIYRSILVLVIFMRAKVGVLSGGIWKGTYRKTSYIFASFSFISN